MVFSTHWQQCKYSTKTMGGALVLCGSACGFSSDCCSGASSIVASAEVILATAFEVPDEGLGAPEGCPCAVVCTVSTLGVVADDAVVIASASINLCKVLWCALQVWCSEQRNDNHKKDTLMNHMTLLEFSYMLLYTLLSSDTFMNREERHRTSFPKSRAFCKLHYISWFLRDNSPSRTLQTSRYNYNRANYHIRCQYCGSMFSGVVSVSSSQDLVRTSRSPAYASLAAITHVRTADFYEGREWQNKLAGSERPTRGNQARVTVAFYQSESPSRCLAGDAQLRKERPRQMRVLRLYSNLIFAFTYGKELWKIPKH